MSRGTINKAILLGRLGRDPEMRYAPSGTAIANFSVATNHKQKAEGEWVDKTEWHNIVAFGKLAEFVGLGKLSFKFVETVNMDEYVGLGPEDPQSYHYFMHDNFFNKIVQSYNPIMDHFHIHRVFFNRFKFR